MELKAEENDFIWGIKYAIKFKDRWGLYWAFYHLWITIKYALFKRRDIWEKL